MAGGIPIAEAARRAGVSAGTLRRWVADGIVPLPRGGWTPAAVAHARIVARLRARGHGLDEIRRAARSGRLSYGYLEDLFEDGGERTYSLQQAADETGLQPALIERFYGAAGLPRADLERISEDDLQMLRYTSAILAAGFPLVAFLQVVRVYGHSIAQMADTEVKLFHLYVHEPLIRDGVPQLQMAEEMQGLAAELLPMTSPLMDHLHQRFLQHFVEQDVVGHMEADEEALDLGRLRVAIAFADLAGYTRLTEEVGEEHALDVVERFLEAVERSLPDDARIIKTIGDGVMVVGSDPVALADWAVGFQLAARERPLPRIGIHHGAALYRDGDYYGSAVNLASRVAARAAGGEVLVTRPIARGTGRGLIFERIGEVKLKGFAEPTELYLARRAEPG